MQAKFVVDESGNKKEVILKIQDFRNLIEELEMKEDIIAAKEALNDKNDEVLDWDTAKKSLDR